jgi:hypothetical protein
MQWICQPRNPVSLHQMWSPPKVAAESRGQRDEGGEVDAGGERPESRPSLRAATSWHLVMNQRFTTRFSTLSGVWQFDDVPLDASTPDPGSVRSTFGMCMEVQLCSRIPELSLVRRAGRPRWSRLSGCPMRLGRARRPPRTPVPPEPGPGAYCRKRFPTELFGTIPRSMRRWPSRALPVRSHFS